MVPCIVSHLALEELLGIEFRVDRWEADNCRREGETRLPFSSINKGLSWVQSLSLNGRDNGLEPLYGEPLLKVTGKSFTLPYSADECFLPTQYSMVSSDQ